MALINCTNIDYMHHDHHYIGPMGHELTITITVMSLICNAIVVVVLLDNRRRRKRHAQLYLLALAFSDIMMGVNFAIGAAIMRCIVPYPEDYLYEFAAFTYMVAYSNRMLTLHIALARAVAVDSITCAIRIQDKSVSRVIIELVLSCVFGVLFGFFSFYFSKNHRVSVFIKIALLSCITIAMIVSVIAIRMKVRPTNHALHPRSSARMKEEFHTLVTVVAITFSFSHIFSIIFYGLYILEDNLQQHKGHISRSSSEYVEYKTKYQRVKSMARTFSLLYSVAMIANAGVNLFIYTAVCRSFRRTFVRFFNHINSLVLRKETPPRPPPTQNESVL